MEKTVKTIKTISLVTLVCSILMCIIPAIKKIQFQQNCSGFLKQAADANSVELCKKSLNKAISYVEANGLTTGYTSVIYKTEDENVEFWYSNLKECQKELNSIDENTTVLEKSNLLMKVRESLLDADEKGTVITMPEGIQYYPHNIIYGILRGLACMFLFISVFTQYLKIKI